MSVFSENLINLRLWLKLKQYEFANKVDSTRANISQYELGNNMPKRDVLAKIAKLSGVTVEDFTTKVWVSPDDADQLQEVKPSDLNWMWVPLVGPEAQAGYMTGFSDPEYIAQLPTVPFIIDKMPKGKYVAFKVKGDSMNNGTLESYASGDIVMCREVKRDLWRYKLHINDWDFIIVHQTNGVILKKIISHDVDQGIIKLHSLNEEFKDFEVSLSEVDQLFNVVQVMRKK